MTYILTCAHVVEAVGGKDKVQIYGKSATVIATTDVMSFDLAVLTSDDSTLLNRSILRLQNSGKEGTKIKITGHYIPHSAGYLRQKIILLRRGTKERQNQILFMRELNRRLNPIDKNKMNRLKTLKNPP